MLTMKTAPIARCPDITVEQLAERHSAPGVTATWMGHASFFVSVDGVRILTDPVWEARCSPVSFAGPKRYSEQAMPLQTLLQPGAPEIDIVLVSHNHYDHLCASTLRQILQASTERGSRPTRFVCPAGVGANLTAAAGIPAEHITELDWWDAAALPDAAELPGLARAAQLHRLDPVSADTPAFRACAEGRCHTLRSAEQPASELLAATRAAVAPDGDAPANPARIVCVPAQHFSARGLLDRFDTLWGGFVVQGPSGHSVYFAGDTGLRTVAPGAAPESEAERAAPACPAFRAIGDALGPIDLALFPIGAYGTAGSRPFFSNVHTSPEDSVECVLDVRAKHAVGMHWGTWPLTDEPVLEPAQRLASALAARDLPADFFTAVQIGGHATHAGVQPESVYPLPAPAASAPAEVAE